MRHEYGIIWVHNPDELHRGPMTYEEANQWIQEFEDDGGVEGVFTIVQREIGDWIRTIRS